MLHGWRRILSAQQIAVEGSAFLMVSCSAAEEDSLRTSAGPAKKIYR
jgi:hypothetical protein